MDEGQPTPEKPQYKDPLDSINEPEDFAQIAKDAGYRGTDEAVKPVGLLQRLRNIFKANPKPNPDQEKLQNLGVTIAEPEAKPAKESRNHDRARNILKRIDDFMLQSGDEDLVSRWKDQKKFGKFYIPYLLVMTGLVTGGALIYERFSSEKTAAPPLATPTVRAEGQASWSQPITVTTKSGDTMLVNASGPVNAEASLPKPMTDEEFKALGFYRHEIQQGDTIEKYADILGIADEDRQRFIVWIAALNNIENPHDIKAFSIIYLPPARSQTPVGP